ncbi:MAG TPA: HNH endonuclease signature motif containing protein [Devosiaceae bacterium]
MIENPPGFVVRSEAQQAASDHGFRRELGQRGGWLGFGSTTAHGEVWIAGGGSQGPWFLAVTHPGVAAELGPPTATSAGLDRPAWVFARLGELHEAVDRAYRLGVSLPDAPLREFQKKTAALPRTTEAERLVVQRVGQDLFRDALLEYWGGQCPLTGITDTALLRASHIVAWAECDSDAQRLDVHNGLLLSALWDAAFDRGLVSFADDGAALVSPALSDEAHAALGPVESMRLQGLTALHAANLAQHRAKYGFVD